MKIYLAGPDVFRPDAEAWIAYVRALCEKYGFKPLTPLDHKDVTAEGIFKANIELIKKAQIVVANLDPFRGPEPDSGTAFELGFAHALGKKIVGYVSHFDTTIERVAIAEGKALRSEEGKTFDSQGRFIEGFGLPVNLMIGVPAQIMEGGLEECLVAIKARKKYKLEDLMAEMPEGLPRVPGWEPSSPSTSKRIGVAKGKFLVQDPDEVLSYAAATPVDANRKVSHE